MNVWYRNIVLEIYFSSFHVSLTSLFLTILYTIYRNSISFSTRGVVPRWFILLRYSNSESSIRRFCSEWNRLCYSVWNGICWRKTILQMESERSPGGSWRVTRRITNDEMHSRKDSARNRIFPRQVSTHEERHGFFRGVSFVEWTFQLLFWVGVLCRIVCSFALTSFLENVSNFFDVLSAYTRVWF